MKPLTQAPVQAGALPLTPAEPNCLPHWTDLPPSRQQEVIRLLATLLLRQWTGQRPTVPEVTNDQPG